MLCPSQKLGEHRRSSKPRQQGWNEPLGILPAKMPDEPLLAAAQACVGTGLMMDCGRNILGSLTVMLHGNKSWGSLPALLQGKGFVSSEGG